MTRAWASLLSVGVLGAADGWGRAGLRANVSDALVDQVHLIFQYLSDEHRARSGCATNLLAEFFPTAESVGLPHSWMAAFGFEANDLASAADHLTKIHVHEVRSRVAVPSC